jgi:hypothetical protein
LPPTYGVERIESSVQFLSAFSNVIKRFSLVEMGGLEPPTPYMRSKEIDCSGVYSIRVFGPLGRLLPIFVPRDDRG